jgi:hypothetical protein
VLLEKNILPPPAVSSTVATKRVAEYFRGYQPEYYIRTVSDRPLNPENRAGPLEMEMLQRFRSDPTLETQLRMGELDGRHYLLAARPTLSKNDCLFCHGDPANAPAQITQRYGTGSGFGWQPSQVVGLTLVGAPIAEIDVQARGNAWLGLALISGFFVLLVLATNAALRDKAA